MNQAEPAEEPSAAGSRPRDDAAERADCATGRNQAEFASVVDGLDVLLNSFTSNVVRDLDLSAVDALVRGMPAIDGLSASPAAVEALVRGMPAIDGLSASTAAVEALVRGMPAID